MEDLKIKVNNEAESKEVQELLFELGYKWHRKGKTVSYLNDVTNGEFGYLVAWSTGCFTNVIQMGRGSEDAKETTIAELRAMVEPKMKEYLIPNRDYEYILTDAREGLEPHAKDWISIPDGANYAYKDELNVHFTKLEMGYRDLALIWVRLSQPEALPFIDDNPQSLNEQYAEIEQVRQAVKVKSGSESDHMAGAMSYGFIGVGAASDGTKPRENNHYFIDVSDVDEVDFYEIAKRYNVTDPAIQHILKKCLAIGNRGHKDLETDLKDILKTAKRALQINGFGEQQWIN